MLCLYGAGLFSCLTHLPLAINHPPPLHSLAMRGQTVLFLLAYPPIHPLFLLTLVHPCCLSRRSRAQLSASSCKNNNLIMGSGYIIILKECILYCMDNDESASRHCVAENCPVAL